MAHVGNRRIIRGSRKIFKKTFLRFHKKPKKSGHAEEDLGPAPWVNGHRVFRPDAVSNTPVNRYDDLDYTHDPVPPYTPSADKDKLP